MQRQPHIPQPEVALRRVRPRDAEIAHIAGAQHGVISLQQLRALGLSAAAVRKRVAVGRLHRVQAGVFAVGHRLLSPSGHRMAAVLRGGDGAALSHLAAGAEWDLKAWRGKHDVTVTTWRRSTPEITFHCGDLADDERTVHNGIPMTTVPRTILDLASLLPSQGLLNVINEAEQRQLADPLSLPAILERHRGRRGTAVLRDLLVETGYGVTRRELEHRFALFVDERLLPRPERNASISVDNRWYSPDCLWRDQRLIVELHSARYHGTAPKVTRDATRDRRLLIAGWLVIHVTWAQLHDPREAGSLERDLWTALSR